MRMSPCCEKVGLKKGPWTHEEDQKLLDYIQQHGHGSWRALPTKAGLQRCGKSCRLRWTNYLRPDIKRGQFSLQEEQTIIQLHALLGNRWSAIATNLPKRTDNEIKNYWNTNLKKRLTKMGIDPVTHKPKTDTVCAGSGNPKDAANLSHMTQWESARLEAEARLVRESKQLVSNPLHQFGGSNTSQVPLINRATSTPLPSLDVLKAWQGTWMKTSLVGDVDDLESPTSTLNFPGCESTVAGALEFAKSSSSSSSSSNNNNPMILCESGMIIKEGCDITTMEFPDHNLDITNYGCTDHNAVSPNWYCFNENFKEGNNVKDVTTLSNIMELCFTDNVLAIYNSEEDQNNSSNIVMEESSRDHQHGNYASGNVFQENNKIYWNSILNNLVN